MTNEQKYAIIPIKQRGIVVINKTESTVIENIVKRNQNNLNGVAFESFGSKLTYKEFFDLVDTLTKGFIELGVKNGDIVTMCMAGTVNLYAAFSGTFIL